MAILNLTQHPATPEQIAAGVVDLPAELAPKVRELLTFEELPARVEMRRRAAQLAQIVEQLGYRAAMIGGAPYFMPILEEALAWRGVHPLYAFSRRESIEEIAPDGSVRKASVFRHIGFVAGPEPAEFRDVR